MRHLSENKHKFNLKTGRSKLFLTVFIATTLAGCSMYPKPITDEQQSKLTASDQENLTAGQKVPSQKITIYDAMARAIKYNFAHRLQQMEESFSNEQIKGIRWESLPHLAAKAGYSYQNRPTASVNKNTSTGATSTSGTTSQSRESIVADLTYSWNILDFGVSYYQAKQEADRELVSSEMQRKSMHNLIEEVQLAYWKAVGAQQLEEQAAAVLSGAKKALALSQAPNKDGLASPITSLRYQLSLINAIRQLEKVRGELVLAQADLAELLNLDPSVPFHLVDSSGDGLPGAPLTLSMEEMEEMALLKRPELRTQQYQSRIDAAETRKAILKNLPGIGFKVDKNIATNPYLQHQQWTQAGLQLTWNIVDVLGANESLNSSKSSKKVGETRRLALHMAVLSQVHIAWLQYKTLRKELLQSAELRDSQQRLVTSMSERAELSQDEQLSFVNNAIETTKVRFNLYQAYARLQNAKGRLQSTLGMDQGDGASSKESILEMATDMRASSKLWKQVYQIPEVSRGKELAKSLINFDAIGKLAFKDSPEKKIERVVVQKKPKTVLMVKKPQEKIEMVVVQKKLKIPLMVKTPKITSKKIAKTVETKLPNVAPKSRQVVVVVKPYLFAVQVGGYVDKKMADNFVAVLKEKGYRPHVYVTTKANGDLWRQVWLGRFYNRKNAEVVQNAYRDEEHRPAFLATIPEQKESFPKATFQSQLQSSKREG
jgi:outer membrane protein TolC